jgi:hypothetical protein
MDLLLKTVAVANRKLPSAAKAGYGGVIYGTAEAVPFLGEPSSHAGSKARQASTNYGTAEAAPFQDRVLTRLL